MVVYRQSNLSPSVYSATVSLDPDTRTISVQSHRSYLHVQCSSTAHPGYCPWSSTLSDKRFINHFHRPRYPPVRTMLPHRPRLNTGPNRRRRVGNLLPQIQKAIRHSRRRSHHPRRHHFRRCIPVNMDPSSQDITGVLHTHH